MHSLILARIVFSIQDKYGSRFVSDWLYLVAWLHRADLGRRSEERHCYWIYVPIQGGSLEQVSLLIK